MKRGSVVAGKWVISREVGNSGEETIGRSMEEAWKKHGGDGSGKVVKQGSRKVGKC